MRLNSRRILKSHTFTDLGAGTVTVEIPCYDISHGLSMTGVLNVTKADTDATDTLDVKIQETHNRVVWNTRGRFETITGNMSPSDAAPEVRELNIMAEGLQLDATEESYETTGSAGGTELVAGAVRNGPFVGPFRGAAGWQPSYRVLLIVTDAGTQNAAFSGSLDIWLTTYS